MFERNIGWLQIELRDLWIHSIGQSDTETINSQVERIWDLSRFPWQKFASEKSFDFPTQKTVLRPA